MATSGRQAHPTETACSLCCGGLKINGRVHSFKNDGLDRGRSSAAGVLPLGVLPLGSAPFGGPFDDTEGEGRMSTRHGQSLSPLLAAFGVLGVLGAVGAPCGNPHGTSAGLAPPRGSPLPMMRTPWLKPPRRLLVLGQDTGGHLCVLHDAPPRAAHSGHPQVCRRGGAGDPWGDSGCHSEPGEAGRETHTQLPAQRGWEQGANGVPSVQQPGGLQGATAEGPFAKGDQSAVVTGKQVRAWDAGLRCDSPVARRPGSGRRTACRIGLPAHGGGTQAQASPAEGPCEPRRVWPRGSIHGPAHGMLAEPVRPGGSPSSGPGVLM